MFSEHGWGVFTALLKDIFRGVMGLESEGNFSDSLKMDDIRVSISSNIFQNILSVLADVIAKIPKWRRWG
jgi:hypothetical protein